MAGRLEGKVAIVFGAGSVGPGWGNGKAAAVQFAREGAIVAAVDLNLEAARETCGIIGSEGHAEASAHAADVTQSDQIKAVVDAVVARHGRVDVLHNNVGLPKMGGPIELSEEDWDFAMAVNLKSMFLTCKHVLPHMLARKKGSITNISSIAAIRWTGYPYPAYYAAKGGVNQFTVGLALQYAAHNIRVNCIMPGMMNTPHIHQNISGQYADADEMVRKRDESCPMGVMGTGWDIAKAAAFLNSDEAQYITGVCLPVDGGISARCA
ncbi:3-oxoacyl-ACP reductase [Alsobacter soli]|uniref:3-oxoacyl-ACP reductase n=1 Tax=Alsobacter soli TaxID=2109933 RepID=A0A2T1HUL6_9HYPH|nr:SDR family oxidoreductase [Alsobacter soli]PSC05356.1 3-oxoacyl-ACP reductase [Alsobacter soli]